MGVRLRGDVYYASWTDASGKLIRESAGRSYAAAQRLYERRKREVEEGGAVHRRLTLKTWLDTYLAGVERKRDHKHKVAQVRVWQEALGGVELRKLTETQIAGVLNRMGCANGTWNRYRAVLGHALAWAAREKLIPLPLPLPPKRQEPPGRNRWLNHQEEDELIGMMDDYDAAVVQLAIHTGLRQSEQFALRWEHITFPARLVTIPLSKHGGSRSVPLNETALAALALLKNESPWVLPSPKRPAHHYSGHAWVERHFDPAIATAAIAPCNWHDLRHTYGSRLAMAGANARTIQLLMGHKSIVTTERYIHLAPSHLLDAVRLLDRPTED